MAGQAGTLEQLALELAGILGQVGTRMRSTNVRQTLGLLGVYFPEQLLANAGFVTATDATATAAQAIEPEVTALLAAIDADDTVQIAVRVATVLAKTTQTLASFANVANQLQAVGPTLPGVTAQQVNDLVAGFPRKLLDLFIAESLDIIPAVGGTLTLLGVVDKVEIPGDPANPTKPSFDKTEVQLGGCSIWPASLGSISPPALDGAVPASMEPCSCRRSTGSSNAWICRPPTSLRPGSARQARRLCVRHLGGYHRVPTRSSLRCLSSDRRKRRPSDSGPDSGLGVPREVRWEARGWHLCDVTASIHDGDLLQRGGLWCCEAANRGPSRHAFHSVRESRWEPA
jgi:hypothetical protein